MTIVEQTFKEFQRLIRRYARFHAVFLAAFVLELLILLSLTTFFAKTLGIAIVVAATFLTVFTYLVLRFYFQTKKAQQLIELGDTFLSNIDHPASKAAWSVEKLYPIYQLIQKLQEQESQYDTVPSSLQPISPLIEKFTTWCYWEDIHWMKETLHLQALRKLFDWVKLYPTDLELHKTLAGAYMALYQIYQMPEGASPFIARQYQSPAMEEKFKKRAHSAIEELKVVLTYSLNDAWALSHIAKVYHDLGLRQEERKTYETLLSLKPQDGDVHYQLGKLYFELGHMAQGLHLYQELQGRKDPKAGELIQHYDAYHMS